MEYDIIELKAGEYANFTVAQRRTLRTAQKKKNELLRKAEKELEDYRLKLLTAGMKFSTLYDEKKTELDREVGIQLEILIDDLKFDLNKDKYMSGGSGVGGDVGYLVDYSLSYSERYTIVRDYYLGISKDERLKRYDTDETAKQYLGSYYEVLFTVLITND